jgi:hypothetical protein
LVAEPMRGRKEKDDVTSELVVGADVGAMVTADMIAEVEASAGKDGQEDEVAGVVEDGGTREVK